ncbi:MAG: hypothetical protein ACTFAL_02695 [Candidatus Electronema sp. V4]|uniref:hypothetical protein n=1 Tax=Candidatus Electronema sp. V4 TaxID=3454756 RepID=UPI0040557074
MCAKENTGGIPALRGFRKQFLHTLNRILSSETGYFYPESLEDFAVRDSAGRVLQVVQVKDYKTDLTFSELKPFFERAAEYITRYPDVQVVLASYGKLGPELQECIGADEATLKKNKKFNTPELLKVFQRLEHRPLNEQDEHDSIQEHLTQFPLITGDWQTACDLLMQELYRGAEQEKGYTRQDLLERLQQIGQYLTAREAHHREWGTSIIPLLEQKIDDREQLRSAFHEGVSVGWQHILSDLDVKRQQHLDAIQEGFKKTKTVVIHGASGQGKSALAYRYLHDYCPAASYEIRDLSTVKRALEVAAALSGYSIPFTFYVDASHNDKGLADFLRSIHEMQHVSCLVTIREEDWRLTGITSADITFTDVELAFNRQEAQELYAAWENAKGSRFPDFEQAWTKFSEGGPLLEFIYLLTHTENLRNRLQKQYDQIADEVDCQQRSENDLKLIKQVAVAGACGARIDLAKLAKLSSPATLQRSINRLEKEYLLRRSNDDRHLTGLHPVRSEILASIIEDPVLCPWEGLALECLPLLEDADIEIFLLHIFRFHSEATNAVLSHLNTVKYETWLAVNGVLRALLWLGIYEYIEQNENLIRRVYETFGDTWWFILNFDFLGLLEDKTEIFNFFPEENRAKVDQWRREQPCNAAAFARLDEWLRQTFLPPLSACKQEEDWNEFGQVAYWMGFRKINKQTEELIDWNALRQTVEKLPIDTLGVLIYGLWQSFSKNDAFIQWYTDTRPTLLNRYRKETNTPYIEEQDGVIRAHFIIPIDDDFKSSEKSNSAGKNSFHALAMRHVNLLAELFPDCTGYGCQGYGHKILDIEYSYDHTTKTAIDPRQLKPDWVLHVNKTARILASHMFRPATWQDYSKQIFSIRNDAVSCLEELRRNLIKHFRAKTVVLELYKMSGTDQWQECLQKVSRHHKFPLESIDKWGYTEEGQQDDLYREQRSTTNNYKIIFAYLQRYHDWLKTKNDYFHSIANFLDKSSAVTVFNSISGKTKTDRERKELVNISKKIKFKNDSSSLLKYQLAESIKNLPQFQSSFRKYFSSLIDSDELSQLEQRELKTLHSLWPLWYCFETVPNRQMTTPGKTASGQLEQRKKILRKKLTTDLKEASTSNLQFNMLEDSVEFDSKPAMWITINGENHFEVYTQLEKIYLLIRISFGDINLHSIEHFSLDFKWQNIIILPICKGKMLEPHAWVIPIFRFISELNKENELPGLNKILREIKDESLKTLRLNLWEPALLNDAKIFLQSAATLQVRLRHLAQLGDIQNLDETGTEIVQSWFEKTQKDISQELQQLLDKSNLLASLHQRITNEYLQIAYKHLIAIYGNLYPEELGNGRAVLSCETIKKWQEQLLSVQGEVFVIYLSWCGYLITTH